MLVLSGVRTKMTHKETEIFFGLILKAGKLLSEKDSFDAYLALKKEIVNNHSQAYFVKVLNKAVKISSKGI